MTDKSTHYISSRFSPSYNPVQDEMDERIARSNLDFQWKERDYQQGRMNRNRMNEYLSKRAKYELSKLQNEVISKCMKIGKKP